MACNTESDGTYCSEVEIKDQSQIRRSKRLSQRNLLSSFRSNGDPIQRLYEINQMLKCDEISAKWLIDDWKCLQFEVECIQKALKGKHKGRISFILKKIKKILLKSSAAYPKETPTIIESNKNDEQVNSPNILAGMMTEILTEIPPYQPKNVPNAINTAKSTETTNVLTQKNPLDLTKKNVTVHEMPHKVLSQDITERQKQQQQSTRTRTRIITLPFELQKLTTATNDLSISKNSMIDLTDENTIETNRENVTPPVVKEKKARRKSPVHVSKWLQFLPTQQRPTFAEKPSRATIAPSIAAKKSKSLKDSIAKLYKDSPTFTTSISNTIQKSLSSSSCPRKPKHAQQSNSPPITNENKIQKLFRNTENITTRDTKPTRVAPRNVQSENFFNISPDFLLDELLELSETDMNDSGTSLTPSLKENFRKVFGTDTLKDVFGGGGDGDEVVYNLKENHIRRLATVLKVEHDTLKKTIENILSNDNYGLFEDDNMQSDSSSVVECSQSPTQRIFQSQTSQK